MKSGRKASFNERIQAKRLMKGRTEGRRPVGSSKGRWIYAVDKDAKSMLMYKNWGKSAEDRDAWKRRIEEAKAHVGL